MSAREDIAFHLSEPGRLITVKVSRADKKPLSAQATVTVNGPEVMKRDTEAGTARFQLKKFGPYTVSLEPKGREARGTIAPVATKTAPNPAQVTLSPDSDIDCEFNVTPRASATKVPLNSFQEKLNVYGLQFNEVEPVHGGQNTSQGFTAGAAITHIEDARDLILQVLRMRSQHVVHLKNGSKEYTEVCNLTCALVDDLIRVDGAEEPIETFHNVCLLAFALAGAATNVDLKKIEDAPYLKEAFVRISQSVTRLSRHLDGAMTRSLLRDGQALLKEALKELSATRLDQNKKLISRSETNIRMQQAGTNNPKFEAWSFLGNSGSEPTDSIEDLRGVMEGYVTHMQLDSSPLSDADLALFKQGKPLPEQARLDEIVNKAKESLKELQAQTKEIEKNVNRVEGALEWRDSKASRRVDAFVSSDLSGSLELAALRALLEKSGAAGMDSALLSVIVDNIAATGVLSEQVTDRFIRSALAVTLTAPYSRVLETMKDLLSKALTGVEVTPGKVIVAVADQFGPGEEAVTTIGDKKDVVYDAEHGATVASIIAGINPAVGVSRFQGPVGKAMFEALAAQDGLIVNLSQGPVMPADVEARKKTFEEFAKLCAAKVVCMALGNDGMILRADGVKLRESPRAIGGGNPSTLTFLKAFTEWAASTQASLAGLSLLLCGNGKMDELSLSDTTNLVAPGHALGKYLVVVTADTICSPANGQTSGGTSWAAPILAAFAAVVAGRIPALTPKKAALVATIIREASGEAGDNFTREGLSFGVLTPSAVGPSFKKVR